MVLLGVWGVLFAGLGFWEILGFRAFVVGLGFRVFWVVWGLGFLLRGLGFFAVLGV